MEQWKSIPGYEGIYEASNEGRIRSVEGKTTQSSLHIARVWKQRIIKQKCNLNHKGRKDFRVELWKNGTHKTWLVSRLIALTWCDGYMEGLTVNHIDGNPLNNYASNLEWISLSDNIHHGFETGLYSTQRGCVLVNSLGEKKSFRSQSQASRWIGRTNSYIANCIVKNRTIKSINGSIYFIER